MRERISKDEFIQVLKLYSSRQSELIRDAQQLYPELSHSHPIDWPRNGTVEALCSVWKFYRHGEGIRFKSEQGEVIDVEISLVEHPAAFEPGRLKDFFCTMPGLPNKKFLRQLSYEEIKKCLDSLSQKEVLERVGRLYLVSSED